MLFKKTEKYILAAMFLVAVLLNILAWSSVAFCDFYVVYIFPVLSEGYSRFSNLFPFSVGEWMLVTAAVLVLVLLGGGFACLAGRRSYRWYRGYFKVCSFIVAAVCLIMTANCLILFHCSPITDFYPAVFYPAASDSTDSDSTASGSANSDSVASDSAASDSANSDSTDSDSVDSISAANNSANNNPADSASTDAYQLEKGREREYSFAELAKLRDYVVTQANELAGQLPRDEAGYLAAKEYTREYLAAGAQAEMRRLGEQFPRLKGYYPRPKPFYFSDFFSQQYMMGYYFPFSMEANYNEKMYIVNIPVSLCHELSHLKGFIYEDEANFLGFLACVDSADPLFRYSAYLSILGYLDRDFYEAAGRDAETYRVHPAISELVKRDDIFLTPAAWVQVEEAAILDTELVKEISDDFVETNLTLNGVADGKLSYGRVVELLLRYYDGKL